MESYPIITTKANDLFKHIHDRMLAIPPRKLEPFRLDYDMNQPAALCDILIPYPAGHAKA